MFLQYLYWYRQYLYTEVTETVSAILFLLPIDTAST